MVDDLNYRLFWAQEELEKQHREILRLREDIHATKTGNYSVPGRASIDDNQDSEIDSPKSQITRRHEKTGHRRKALPDPAKLSDGRDPSFEMWLSNIEFKISAEP